MAKTNGSTAIDLKLRPLADRVVVRPLGREETTKSRHRAARHRQGKTPARHHPRRRAGPPR